MEANQDQGGATRKRSFYCRLDLGTGHGRSHLVPRLCAAMIGPFFAEKALVSSRLQH